MSETPQKHPLRRDGLGTRIVATVLLASLLSAATVSAVATYASWRFLSSEIERRAPLALARSAADLWQWTREASDTLAAAAADEAPSDLPGLVALAHHDEDARTTPRWLRGVPWEATTPPGQASEGWPALTVVRRISDGATSLAVQRASKDGLWIAVLDPEALSGFLAIPEMGAEARIGFVVGHPAALPPAHRLDFVRTQDRLQVAVRHPLAMTGVSLQYEQPFHVVFAPIASMLAWVLALDLLIVALFTWQALRNTRAIVGPITALSEGAQRIAAGELDVAVAVPRSGHELAFLTRTFNEMTRGLGRHQAEIETAAEELRVRNEELQQANDVLEQLSITDGLTKLHNHRYFQDFLTREIKRVGRRDEPLTLLVIDIDDFKQLNDRRGHAAGDELLKGLATILNDSVRESDLVARYGGEEFVVLASNTDLEGATRLAEKIRMAVQDSSFILDETMQIAKLTVSIGVSLFEGDRRAFFRGADQALYRAKGAGKNCVVVDGTDDPVTPAPIEDERGALDGADGDAGPGDESDTLP